MKRSLAVRDGERYPGAMDQTKAQNLLSRLINKATAAGADTADGVIVNGVSHGVSWRLGQLEDVERSESLDLGVRLMFGARSASVSTTDLSTSGLDDLVDRCASMAKAAPEDPYVGLAPKDQLACAPFADLDLGDYDDPGTEALKSLAGECEDAALGVDGVVNSSGASASYGEGRKWLMTSHGFFGETGGSSHSVSVSVLAEDANGMERDYDFDSKTHRGDLRAPAKIGLEAGRRAVARLSPRKIKSQKAPVLFDNHLSRSIIGHLAGAINGAAIARGVSFLKDKMGEQIFAENINIIDDPFIKRGHGSRPFDGEGVAAEKLKLIDNGVLTSWILNAAHGRQLGLRSNGRATRGVGGAPGASSTNMFLQPGLQTPDELMKSVGTGLLVTDMFGPQVNANTGDYSVGCSGFWLEDGAPAYPVSEITIAGNLLEMFANLTPANDLEFRGASNAPTILLGEMTVAGD